LLTKRSAPSAGAHGLSAGYFKPAPIQAELALDAVKVVRNDLNDADLEVIPAEVEAATFEGTPTKPSPAPTGAAGGLGWSRLAALVGAPESL
jgi:hypothetical protein